MMGRLVDTDTLKKAIIQDWFLDILLTKNGKSEIKKPLIDMIDSLTKSYDAEKVIELIQKKHCKKCRNILGILGSEEYCKKQKCEIWELCEIVRKGGAE